MELNIERFNLLKALEIVKGSTARNQGIPILNHTLLEVVDGQLSVSAYCYEAFCTASVEAEGSVDGAISLPSDLLYSSIRKLPDGAMVALCVDGTRCTVKAGRSQFYLSTLPANDFPRMDAGENEYSFTISADEFTSLITPVRGSVCTETTRPYLTGVRLRTEDGKLVAVGIDGVRIAVQRTDTAERLTDIKGVTVPSAQMGEILRLIKSFKGDIKIYGNDAKITLEAGTLRYTSKLIDGEFPIYSKFLDKANELRVTLDRKVLIGAVDRVGTFAGSGGGTVRLDFEGDLLAISNEIKGDSGGSEKIYVDFEGDSFSFGLNCKNFLEMISVLTGNDVVLAFEVGDCEMSNAYILCPDDPNYLGLIVPSKIARRVT